MNDFLDRSVTVRRLVLVGGIALAVLVVFSFGMFVGEQKARFSYRWGANYHRSFGGPPPGRGLPPFGPGRPGGFFGGHGATGEVIRKTSDRLIVKSPDNAEKIVLITKETTLIKGRETIELKDVKARDRVVIVGSPDDKGRIKARLIRVFDAALWRESVWPRGRFGLPAPRLQRS